MNILKLDPSSLHLDPANARKHTDPNIDAIKASLARFGQQTPIVIDADDVVRKGNGTVMAALALGWKWVAAVRTELSGTEATGYAIADNRSGELAEWDNTALTATLTALRAESFDLADVGFTGDELDTLLAGMATDGQWAAATGALPTGPKSPFQTMTFTLSDAQADSVKAAMDQAKAAGPFDDTGNENSNGNALARICAEYAHG